MKPEAMGMVDPKSIDLSKALDMTMWHDWRLIRQPKKLSYKSDYYPAVIDFKELGKMKPPKGYGIKVFSNDIRIETSSFVGYCPGARHYYCTIRFYGPSLMQGDCSICGAVTAKMGRIIQGHGNIIDVYRPVTEDDLADKYADWEGFKVGDMTHRWNDTKNAIECAKRIVELRFRNYGKIYVEDCNG